MPYLVTFVDKQGTGLAEVSCETKPEYGDMVEIGGTAWQVWKVQDPTVRLWKVGESKAHFGELLTVTLIIPKT